MKKYKFLKSSFLAAVCGTLILASCATKPVVKIEESASKTPTKEQDEPADEPANVKFAKQLQQRLAQNDIKGAISLFDNLPSELQDDKELKLVLGALFYSDHQFDNAISTANDVLKFDKSNIEALELISMCNKAKGDKTAYKQTADKILAVDPYNPSVNIQKGDDYALNKKYKLARNSYQRALKGDKENIDAKFGYARMAYFLDDTATAKTVLQEILDKDPKNAAANAYMGKLKAEDENYLSAANYISKALKTEPTNYDYWLDYGNYLRHQGKFEEATEAWNKAVSLDPSYFLAYAYLAGNYDDLEKWDLALENYHKVIETNPKYYFAYEETGILEYRSKNYEAAAKYFTKTLEYSDNWSYYLMIAACYFKMGDSSAAKKILQTAMKKQEANSTEQLILRFYAENYNKNAETTLNQRIEKESNRNTRGKMLFYMGLYCELNGADELAREYYSKVTSMSAPMFFEYRIAEWGLKK